MLNHVNQFSALNNLFIYSRRLFGSAMLFGYWFFDTIAVTSLIRTLEKGYEEVGIE